MAPSVRLAVQTVGRFLCIEVTNLGAPARFFGIVQPGRGTASAAIARTALWHHTIDAEVPLETNQAALIRIAQRDRPPGETEDDGTGRTHPEGPQAWRMCFLKRGVGAALERVCPVVRRSGPSELDGVVLTMMSEPALKHRTAVKSVAFEGVKAIDPDTHAEYRVDDSPRH